MTRRNDSTRNVANRAPFVVEAVTAEGIKVVELVRDEPDEVIATVKTLDGAALSCLWPHHPLGAPDPLQVPRMDVQWTYADRGGPLHSTSRRRSRRMDIRTTPEEREMIDRAITATGTDLTEFVVTHAYEAAQRLLADRDRFDLDVNALDEWEALNARPARELLGLRRLMQRPTPFME
ncbi:MAG: type II toxin-antitoxin system TacA family antitoxin [Acidimicrobiales bacterium]